MTGRVCPDCERPLRKNWEPLSARPGTVAESAKGLCHRCYQARKRRGVLMPVKPVEAVRDLSVSEQTVLYALMRNLRGAELDRLSSMLGLADDSRSQSMYGASQALSSIQPMGAHL